MSAGGSRDKKDRAGPTGAYTWYEKKGRDLASRKKRGMCWGHFLPSSPEMDCREWMCRVSEGRIASGVGDQQNSWAEVGVRYPEMVHGAGASSQDRSRSRWERKVDRTMSSW